MRVALDAAAQVAVDVLLPLVATLEGLVPGGERTAVEAVLSDPRLAPLAALPRGRLLDVPDPRRSVLEQSVARARAVRVRVVDPPATAT